MRVVGSRKTERLPCDRKGVNRLRKVSYGPQSAGSFGNLRDDNYRVESRVNIIFAGLYPDLDDAPIEGVTSIGVKCIKGDKNEQKDQEGKMPTRTFPASTLIFHE